MQSDRKIFVLDTSVLIHDPTAIHNFHEHDVIIPYVVIREIDSMRAAPNGRGMAARDIIRDIEDIRLSSPSLSNAPLGHELGNISIEHPSRTTTPSDRMSSSERDDLVISCAKTLSEGDPDRKVVIVSKDIGLRIKASISDIEAEDYRRSKVTSAYTGLHEGLVTVECPAGSDLHKGEVPSPDDLIENEFA
jgi:PhoH-like ATPase